MTELATRCACLNRLQERQDPKLGWACWAGGLWCRPQQAEQQDAKDVEEFDQVEKLQQLGINAGELGKLGLRSLLTASQRQDAHQPEPVQEISKSSKRQATTRARACS